MLAEISCKDCNDLSGLIIQLRVRAGRKNPYYVFFPKTDTGGTIIESSKSYDYSLSGIANAIHEDRS
jgi:hypothetical protein